MAAQETSTAAGTPWRPRWLAHYDPTELTLAFVRPEGHDGVSRWEAEAWPRIDPDGRIRRAERIAMPHADDDRSFGLFRVPAHARSGVGDALAKAIDEAGGESQAPPAAIAVVVAEAEGQQGPPRRGHAVGQVSREEWERAEEARWLPYAWSHWRWWRGDADTIAHVGRSARWAIEEAGHAVDCFEIEIGVQPPDRERFSSPGELVADLSAHAARHLRSARVTVRGGGITVLGRITRDRDQDQRWLSDAALLEVRAESAEDADAVAAVHERVRAAMERGRVRHLAPCSTYVGQQAVDARGEPLDDLTNTPEAKASQLPEYGVMLLIAVLVVLLLVLFGGAVPWGVMFWFIVAGAAAIGLVFVTWKFAGGVLLGPSRRTVRVRAALTSVVGAGVGATVGATVKALSDAVL